MNTQGIRRALKKAAPTIISICTGIGVFATAYFSAKAGSMATGMITYEEMKDGEELTLKEKVQLTAPQFIPAACALTATIGSIVVGRIVDKKLRTEAIAIWATAYKTLENKFKDYQDVVKRAYGKEVHAKILQEANIPMAKETYVHGECFGEIVDGPFDMDEEVRTFYDTYSGQYFKASIGQVMRAELNLNRNFSLAGDVCLKDWYDFLGIPAPDDAKELWWAVEDWMMFVDFHHYKTVLDDGFECGMIEFACDPHPYPCE